jgi:hypothetical protein
MKEELLIGFHSSDGFVEYLRLYGREISSMHKCV